MSPVPSVLVPVSPEGLSPAVLDAVRELRPGHVEIVTVVAPQSRVNPHTTLPDAAYEEARWGEDREAAMQLLRGVGVAPTARVERRVLRGTPAEAVVARAAEGDFSFIVMATRGNTGLRRVVLGSVTDEVVRTAPCPVVVVPPGLAAQ